MRSASAIGMLFIGCIYPYPALAVTPAPTTQAEAECGPHPFERLIVSKPEVCEKQESVWQPVGGGFLVGQNDSVDVVFTQVPTTANQNLLEIDVTCRCTASAGECYTVSTPVDPRTLCPQGYQLADLRLMPSPGCFATVHRPLRPPPWPLTNVIRWTEGPFRITYDRLEGLSDAYEKAVKEQICACQSRPTHKSFYQELHQRCFGEQPNVTNNTFVGTELQFENPTGTPIRCQIRPEELARIMAQYQECIHLNTAAEQPAPATAAVPQPTPYPSSSSSSSPAVRSID